MALGMQSTSALCVLGGGFVMACGIVAGQARR